MQGVSTFRAPQAARSDAKIGAVEVEHRDFARSGSAYLKAALAASSRRLMVVDTSQISDDLVQDLIAAPALRDYILAGRREIVQLHLGGNAIRA